MTTEYTLPGWKLGRIKIRLVPTVALGWLLAFLACWPVAYCVRLLSRVGDRARIERTFRDLDPLVDALGKAYLAELAKQGLDARASDATVNIRVRQLIRTGLVPASFFSPSIAQPQSLSNAWEGPIANSVSPAGIRIDMIYIPNRLCSSFLERANFSKRLIHVATAVGSDNYVKLPVNSATARTACIGRTSISFVFAAPVPRTEP